MKCLILAIACLITSCAATTTAPQASTPSSASSIGKTDQFGTVVVVDLPSDDDCHRKYVSVELVIYDKCLIPDLTYVQVANAIGYKGTELSESGSTKSVQWNNGSGGYITVIFVDGKLKTKSQVGLN